MFEGEDFNKKRKTQGDAKELIKLQREKLRIKMKLNADEFPSEEDHQEEIPAEEDSVHSDEEYRPGDYKEPLLSKKPPPETPKLPLTHINPKVHDFHLLSAEDLEEYTILLNKRANFEHYKKEGHKINKDEKWTLDDNERLTELEQEHFLKWSLVLLNYWIRQVCELGKFKVREIARRMRHEQGINEVEAERFAEYFWKNLPRFKEAKKYLKKIEKAEFERNKVEFILRELKPFIVNCSTYKDIELKSNSKSGSKYTEAHTKCIYFHGINCYLDNKATIVAIQNEEDFKTDPIFKSLSISALDKKLKSIISLELIAIGKEMPIFKETTVIKSFDINKKGSINIAKEGSGTCLSEETTTTEKSQKPGDEIVKEAKKVKHQISEIIA